MRIVLASASPRRRELLEQAGIDFEILIGSTRECITKEEPEEIVEELSLAKAKGVAEAVTGDAVIIGRYDRCQRKQSTWETKRCRRCTSDACHASGREASGLYGRDTVTEKRG